MPQTYIKKGIRCQWSPDDLKKAIEDIRANVFTIRDASRAYQIPRTTLQQYINSGTRKHELSADHEPGKQGKYTVLSKEFETELCEHAKHLSDMYFGITKDQLCKLAYELAWKNGIKHSFNVDKQSAGDDWFKGFIVRNPSISLRKPESTSIARVIGFRRSEVDRFFENLAQVYAKEKFDASRVFNVDETGMSTVQQQKQKILAPTGKKQIGKIVSAEKGETITAVVCVNAAGTFVPPMLIFPRKNMNPRLMNGAPPGAIGVTSPSGWINGELYIKWLDHFIRHTGASADRKVLLILDNHESHITLQAWQLCRENGVVVVSLPPHCSHKCQPLDLTIFGPLKTAYFKRCGEWMSMNPGKRITQYEVATLFGDAYCAVGGIQKCINGFRAAGIYPLNSSVFTDDHFRAAENLVPKNSGETASIASAENPEAASTSVVIFATEPSSEPTEAAGTSAVASATESSSEPATGTSGVASATEPIEMELEPAETVPPSASNSSTTNPSGADRHGTPSKKRRVSVAEISPIPTVTTVNETKRRRKCKRSEIFTASPIKSQLKKQAAKKAQIHNEAKKVVDKSTEKQKQKKTNRKKASSSTSSGLSQT